MNREPRVRQEGVERGIIERGLLKQTSQNVEKIEAMNEALFFAGRDLAH